MENETKEFEAKNVDVAIWNASQELKVPIEEMDYEILDEGKRGGGPARIRVYPAGRPAPGAPPAPERSAPEPPRREAVARAEPSEAVADEPEPGPDDELVAPDEDLGAAAEIEEDDPIEEARRARRARRHEEPPRAAAAEMESETEPEPRRAEDQEILEEGVRGAKEMLPPLLEDLGLALEIDYEIREDHVYISMEGDDGEYLLRDRAEGLNALQFLLNKMVYRGGPTRLVLDVNSFRRDRQEQIVAHAKEVAREVRETGESRTLGPMNPFERRLVHLALRDDPEVQTASYGDAFMKRLEITRRGAGRRDRGPGPGGRRGRSGRRGGRGRRRAP